MTIVPLSSRLQHAKEYYFSKKLEQVRQMNASGANVINLGIGNPDMPPPATAIEAATKALHTETMHGYASYRSTPELRQSMTAWYEKTYGVRLDPEKQILPLLGSKEGVLYVSLAFLNLGDGVLVPNPGYPAYSSVASIVGAKIYTYDLTAETGWQPDLKKLEKQDLAGCKLMWINYPHMPTGASAAPDLFKRLVEFARKKRLLLCSDNPYGLVLNETAPQSLLKVDPGMEVTLELNSMSKSFNMAGWRVGMLAGSEETVNAVLAIRSNVDSGIFLAVQAGANAALRLGDEWHNERNRHYRERRKLVWRLFDKLGYSYAKDQVGLFVWAKAPDHIADVEKHLDEVLLKAQVFLTPGFIFGSNGSRYARAALCASEQVLEEALRRVEKL